MSAYMVETTHIDALVWLATRPRSHCHGLSAQIADYGEIDDTIGARLIAENRASINYRYPDTVGNRAGEPGGSGIDIEPPYSYTAPVRFPTTVEALKIVRCYEYQACEHPAWSESWAHGLCERLTSTLIGELPGYDKAPWGWDGKPEPGHGPMIELGALARRQRGSL